MAPLSERTIAEIREGAKRTGDAAVDIEQVVERWQRSKTLQSLVTSGNVRECAEWFGTKGAYTKVYRVDNREVEDPDPKNFPSEQFIASLIILIGALV